jgi:hypothetical protein
VSLFIDVSNVVQQQNAPADVLTADKGPPNLLVILVTACRRYSAANFARLWTEFTIIPLLGVLEFGEAEAGLDFAFTGEKLLHQPFFMGLERVHFPRLRGHQLVHRTQALGDFLLFGGGW